jgi:membrane-associated phospholipid phosphatase
MPFLVLVVISLACGLAAYAVAGRLLPLSARPARAVEEEAVEHAGLRRLLRRRLDPEVASGLALTVALVVVIGGALLVGVLALLLRTSHTLVQVDRSAADWGSAHAGESSTRLLNMVTDLASTTGVIVILTLVAVIELVRAPSRWIVPFLLVVTLGDTFATIAVKGLVDRARPTLNPLAETLGPSFPSGHSSTAAAMFAACALLLSRRRGLRTRTLLAAVAVALAVAVACSRVLLDLHWMSDVIAGLALGWAWFAACAIAFGGRMLEFGDSARRVAADANAPERDRAALHVASRPTAPR